MHVKTAAPLTHPIKVLYTFMYQNLMKKTKHHSVRTAVTQSKQQAFWQMLLPRFALGSGPTGEGHGN